MSLSTGHRPRRPASWLAELALAGVLLAGCAAPPPPPPPRQPPQPRPAPVETGSAVLDRKPVFVGRTLIYPVRHERAEDAAAMLQSLYPYARIVPHLATNSLLIYMPPRREIEQMMRGGATGPAGQPTAAQPARPPQGVQPQAVQPQSRQSSSSMSRGRTR